MSDPSGHLVAIGASWGGLDVLRTILQRLPVDLGAAVVVAQHRSPESHPTAFRDLLGAVTMLLVREAEDKDELATGTVYVAAPDYHLLVDGARLALSTEGPILHARPSIDVLLETAAESYRDRCVGVVLTGANDDGAHGLARVVELGGAAIVQDPATAVRTEMPDAALRAAPRARVEAPEGIADAIVELCGVRTAA
jgi:two-component system, chemotaxis family, protein-glutamate methylesterase/glutaminase